MKKYQLGIVGLGNMGQAILSGIISSRFLSADKIAAYDLDQERSSGAVKKYNIDSASLEVLSRDTGAILIAVKPQQISELLDSIKPFADQQTLIISIAAGITIGKVKQHLSSQPVIRSMPNTPALILKGITAVSASSDCSPDNISFANELFRSIGKVVEVPENQINAVTAISGSGPAYFYEFTRLIAKVGYSLGLSEAIAQQLAMETFVGSAQLFEESGMSLDELRNMVISKGGTTEAALDCFEREGLEEIITRALNVAQNRAIELSN